MKMRNAIKLALAVFMLFATTPAVYSQTKAEKKAIKKEAKDLAKQGYRITPGDLTLEEQVALSKPILRDKDQWITGVALTRGRVYDAARSNALMAAKVELAKAVEQALAGKIEYGDGNDQGSAEGSTSATRNREAVRSKFASQISHPKILMDCYRQMGDEVEVMLRLAIPYNEAEKSYLKMVEEIKEMMKK